MPTSNFELLGRKKSKTKEYSDDGKMVTKTKTISTPEKSGVTKNVTKTTTRPTFVEGVKRVMDFQPVGKTTTTSVSYNKPSTPSPEQKLREEKTRRAKTNAQPQMNKAKQFSRPDTPLANTPEPKMYK